MCAVGKHQEIWDYLIIGSFETCFSFAWGVLQYEIDIPWHRFRSQLKRSNSYIGKFAEIKKALSKPTFDSGMQVGNSIFIFDKPAQIEVGLSKPVYASLIPDTPDFVFGHQMYRGAEELVYQNQLRNYSKLKNLGVEELTVPSDESVTLIERKLLKYSSYPLIITDSPFILAKVYTEGLIGGFVANILSLSSVNQKSSYGIKKEIYEWVKPSSKKVLIVQEKQKKFCQEGYYTELKDYSTVMGKAIENTNFHLKLIGSSISRIEVDKKITSPHLVEKISQKLNLLP